MTIKILGKLSAKTYQPLPFFIEAVPAGFPSPAEGYADASIDLNELCITHPSATFLVRSSGHSMINKGIFDNDLLVVDRSIEAVSGDIVVCMVNGEFTVKELVLEQKPMLVAHNPEYQNIELNSDMDFEVFGVVTNVIRSFK
ncbi:translesion error-prone DNA polymerase V autoproteolytic subunit [Psychrobacter sp. HD31]|uniref:LexA family protein n=1 Tax=Psychrobacter sp. HD31 TaxID=3112003 RepID=UPI003DA29752